MVKTYVPNQLLEEWFIKFLFPSIIEDVAKGGVMNEEQVIAHFQYLDPIYTQFGMLYVKIPNAPRPLNVAPSIPGKESHAADDIIGFVSL